MTWFKEDGLFCVFFGTVYEGRESFSSSLHAFHCHGIQGSTGDVWDLSFESLVDFPTELLHVCCNGEHSSSLEELIDRE